MDFVWSSSVSTNLLAITCQVYTLLFRLFHPPNTCVCVDKGKNKKWEIQNVVCGQRNEGGINLMNTEGRKKGSSSLTWGGGTPFFLWLCVCATGWSWHNSLTFWEMCWRVRHQNKGGPEFHLTSIFCRPMSYLFLPSPPSTLHLSIYR